MAPASESRTVPPKDGIYRPLPRLKQARFAPPRRPGRTYGKPRRQEASSALKQQTLTQINFVPGGSESLVVLSDSEDESDEQGQQEPQGQRARHVAGRAPLVVEEDDTEDEEPRRSAQRRIKLSIERRKRRSTSQDGADRTASEAGETAGGEKKRRTMTTRPTRMASPARPVKQAPLATKAPSSSLHTQTLTQFLEKSNQGFEAWLVGEGMPMEDDRDGVEDRADDHEGSVVPQTPPPRDARASSDKSLVPESDDEECVVVDQHLPSKGSVSQGEERATNGGQDERYPRSLVIPDSLGMDSWGSEASTIHQFQGSKIQRAASEDKALPSVETTPEVVRSQRDQAVPSSASKTKTRPRVGFHEGHLVEVQRRGSPRGGSSSMPIEIPDSEEDLDDDDDADYDLPCLDALAQGDRPGEEPFSTGVETQRVLEELAHKDHPPVSLTRSFLNTTVPASKAHKARVGASPAAVASNHARITPPSQHHPQAQPIPQVFAPDHDPANRPPKPRRPLRRPAIPRTYEPSQFADSQRVAPHILRALPDASARTDIILPLGPGALDAILGGFELALRMPFHIPRQVVRFWLFDGSYLRYMACVQPTAATHCTSTSTTLPTTTSTSLTRTSTTTTTTVNATSSGLAAAAAHNHLSWTYPVDQIYELNNPVSEDDMRDEGWVTGPIRRYDYLPPAIVGQLLWNLKHALFDETGTDPPEHHQATQIVPSGPVLPAVNDQDPGGRNPEPRSPIPRQEPPPQPDEANSTPRANPHRASAPTSQRPSPIAPISSPPTSTQTQPKQTPILPSPPSASLSEPHPSSSQPIPQSSIASSLVFQDLGDSFVIAPPDLHLNPSQLLTKSQMLPDTLIRDVHGLPYEIWDSEDDVE